MTKASPNLALEEFKAFVAERLGLACDKIHPDRVRAVLDQRLSETACASLEDYVRRLSSQESPPSELRILATALTNGETYFFRGNDHWRAFTEAVLPELAGSRKPSHELRVLSAGCSTGEEAYTLALLLDRYPDLSRPWKIGVCGFDIDEVALERAAGARYSAWSLRRVDDATRRACFSKRGKHFELDKTVRDLVRFEQRNLLEDDPSFWHPGAFDVIFCRNVLIYFTPEAVTAVLRRLEHTLAPGGFLFLGHSESGHGKSAAMELQSTHGTFYYRRAERARALADSERSAVNQAREPLVSRFGDSAQEPAAHTAATATATADTDLDARLRELRTTFDESFTRPVAGPIDTARSVLLIRLAEEAFVLPLGELTGLHRRRKVVPLPTDDPHLVGLAGIHGRAVPVFSLRGLLGIGERDGEHSWLALCRAETGGPGEALALALDHLEGFFRVPGEAAVDSNAAAGAHTSGLIRIGHRMLPVIDVASLVAAVRSKNARRGKVFKES